MSQRFSSRLQNFASIGQRVTVKRGARLYLDDGVTPDATATKDFPAKMVDKQGAFLVVEDQQGFTNCVYPQDVQ